jgi:8-oxo-dGTP diphosphatase
MAYQYEYPRPALTTDCVVFAPHASGEHQILLIERARPPFEGSWALPGGFLEMDEELVDGAMRELQEETGLVVASRQLIQFGAYGKVGRDPRGRTISVVYGIILDRVPETIAAASDAARLQWFPVSQLPPLAFDHDEIVKDAMRHILHHSERSR